MKSKHCLTTLKCTLVSPADEELLFDFIAHSSIEVLVIHLLVTYFKYGIEVDCTFQPVDKLISNCISVGLNVKELKKHKKILPPSLTEYPFPLEFHRDQKPNLVDGVFVALSTAKKLVSIIKHWKLSIQYLKYSLPNFCNQLYHRQSETFYRTVFDCPLLKELDISINEHSRGIDDVFRFVRSSNDRIVSITDGLRTHHRLQSLTLFYPKHICTSEVLSFQSPSIKKLELVCYNDLFFDTAIGQYLRNDKNLEVLILKHRYHKSAVTSGLLQGLQVNTCLKKLIISKRYPNISITGLANMFQFNTTLQFLEVSFSIDYATVTKSKLLPIFKALSINKSLKHLYLIITPYISVSTEDADAIGDILAENATLEVFHLETVITDCSPIVRGLLRNKTLKEFGTLRFTLSNVRSTLMSEEEMCF